MSFIKWGICGTGHICHDFVNAVGTLPKDHHIVVAVAGRNFEKTKTFASSHRIDKACETYDDLIQDPFVDVVYIGVINAQHKQLAIKAMQAGKHVLCEKPLAVNAKEVREMVDCARETDRFLMEGFWSRCFPVYQKIKETIEGGAIGEPKMLTANFGHHINEDGFLLDLANGGGYLLAIGCYLTQLSSWVFGGKKPDQVIAGGILSPNGADVAGSISLHYPNGGIAQLMYANFNLKNDAIIVGTHGKLTIPDHFWCPTKFEDPSGHVHEFSLPKCHAKMNFANSSGLAYEAEAVRTCLSKGLKENPSMSLEESVIISEIHDEIRRQLDVKYPQDDETTDISL